MAAKRKVTKQPARRKAAEDDVEDLKDLDNAGDVDELTPGTSGDEEGRDITGDTLEKDFEPKHSALEAAKVYSHLRELKNYFGEGGEGDLSKMDHPGMSEGLKDLIDDGGLIDKAMQHVKDLVGEHHPHEVMSTDEQMDKMCKALDDETDKGGPPDGELGDDVRNFDSTTKDDSFETGEDNLVSSNAIPDGDLGEEEEEPEAKDETANPDTEEILERYQNPKTGKWMTRKAGVAWRAKNGRVYTKLAPRIVKGFGGQGLSDAGNTDELKPGEDVVDRGIIDGTLTKGVGDEHLDAIGKAADHLDAAAGHPETPPMHKSAHAHHAKALRKTLDDLGNPEEVKDGMDGPSDSGDLTDGVEELKDGPPDGETGTDLVEGVEELKDMEDEGNPEEVKAKSKKSLSPTVSKVLAELRASRQELTRKARMHGLLNGN